MKSKHRTKIRLTCKAPNELTAYNKQWNERIHQYCTRPDQNKFDPDLTCFNSEYGKCRYLETMKYK